jgi:predicted nucleotidyltransferase component of viral defense system
MITKNEINNLVSAWGLRDDVIEKDYVLGWLLWGIGSDSTLNVYWAFKGGTSLKKCYLDTLRFSEDLDFTVAPSGPYKPEDIDALLPQVLERVSDKSGINFSAKKPFFKFVEDTQQTEGRIYYQGPRGDKRVTGIKLDISGAEKIIQPTILRKIFHPYSDELPKPATIRCYAFEEVFAEKLRAMGQRGRPRDLYDIVFLFKRKDKELKEFGITSKLIRTILKKKCEMKGIPTPTLKTVQDAPTKIELISEWGSMLGHQLQILPPFEQLWKELPSIFRWLNSDSISNATANRLLASKLTT